ncbi:hypothetical protein [Campylobacter sp. MG1]|uniref:hypothetical protein n=1 Tax=Campylobacter sp. MG1 TaxID=2976332 RepID=UPI00226CAA6D|nr:hypothetical protein [Campylobacter sp. MG1]
MKKYSLIALSILLMACSSSKQYYEPKNTQELKQIKVKDDSLLSKFKNYEIINKKDEVVFISNNLGFLKGLKDNEIIYDEKFPAKIVSIDINNDKAIMVDALNNVIIYDLSAKKYLFSQNYGQANGIIKKLANPQFNGKFIIVPTLDGKLLIFNNDNNTFFKSINVGTQDFFNNIIFFDTNKDSLVAASSSKIFTIVDNKSYIKILNIKKVFTNKNDIYVLANDGRIIKYDYLLKEKISTKFKYANFNAVHFYNSNLYALEFGGYLIKLDENLKELAVYDLNGKVKKGAYFKDNILFYNNKSYELQ